jgi:hypothetical protein
MFISLDAFHGVVCAYIEPFLHLFKNCGVYRSRINAYKCARFSAQRTLYFIEPRMLLNFSNRDPLVRIRG